MGFPFRGPAPVDEDQTGILGPVIDWKARLQGLLVAPQAIMGATKAIPGILRFATDAEALAATFDGAALTPKQALALLRGNPLHYATLNALFAAAAPEGTLAVVDRYAIGVGYHRESVWHMRGGAWEPVGCSVTVEGGDRPTVLAVLNAITTLVVASGAAAFMPPGSRGVWANAYGIHVWDGGAWNWQGDTGSGTQRFVTASVGTGDIRIADLPNDMSDVHVHLVAPNFDRQERLWCARSPYNSGGTVNLVTSTQINNSVGYGATTYSIQNYGLYARIANIPGSSPVSGRATVMPGGNN